MNITIAVLPGDGIGPEVTGEAIRVLNAVGERFGHHFEYHEALIGGIAIDTYGVALTPETVDLCRKSDAVLLGAVGGPKWDDPNANVRPEDGLLAVRKELKLFANIRPVKMFPVLEQSTTLKPDVVRGVDLVILRELTGGLYFGRPRGRTKTSKGRRVVDTLRYTEQEIERILRVGFELARGRRKRLTSVDKANVLESSRLWRAIAIELAPQYPDVTLEHVLVDSMSMHLIRRPATFDVVVAENMFGDILSDEASMLAGSMGVLPSASLGQRGRNPVDLSSGRVFGLYEPIHGSAPDIAGKGIANPIGSILSAAMMLRYSCGLAAEAAAIEGAVAGVLDAGHRTADLAQPGEKPTPTVEIGRLIAARVRAAA